ncbi:MAG: TolC family protein [Candidatus Cloacimonadaceae bacterium]|nr:TolC family protein [Candidatus Cloacimonadota bacterium]MDY0127525.1 TolC family protein [Candidatus Cloacimonadaceae bacterium]MCB5254891.1 TolC family protein [Candidatus Cloacimonadota bacterium]MCK9177751.1 TolC family protein [Candidatus Cloacimonadota bacterium]MCK9242280.1 TolC family protein [Candidatus Cloacimonadota bacterium]
MKHYLILLLLLPMVLAAKVYTLDELIEHGIENSYQIQKEELSNQSGHSSFRSAKWNLLPNANLSTGLTQDLDPISPQSGLSSFAGFEISKNISLNDPAYFNYRFARLDRSRADLTLQKGYSTYVYQVFQAYIKALSATKKMSSLQENIAIQNRVWEQSKVMLRLGKTVPFEVKQNEIAVMNSQISLIQLENIIENARMQLFALVQMSDLGYPLAELEVDTEKDIPSFSTENMLELKILQRELERNDIFMTQNFLENFPTVSLGYGFSRRVNGADFDFDKYSTVHSLNLNLSYSLWNVFTNRESGLRYKINKQMAQLNFDDKAEQSKREYDIALNELQYLLRLDELYSERLLQATEQIRIAEERYRLGMIQLLELDRTRTNYIDADIEYNANRYEIIQKQEALNYLLSQQILGKW